MILSYHPGSTLDARSQSHRWGLRRFFDACSCWVSPQLVSWTLVAPVKYRNSGFEDLPWTKASSKEMYV